MFSMFWPCKVPDHDSCGLGHWLWFNRQVSWYKQSAECSWHTLVPADWTESLLYFYTTPQRPRLHSNSSMLNHANPASPQIPEMPLPKRLEDGVHEACVAQVAEASGTPSWRAFLKQDRYNHYTIKKFPTAKQIKAYFILYFITRIFLFSIFTSELSNQ